MDNKQTRVIVSVVLMLFLSVALYVVITMAQSENSDDINKNTITTDCTQCEYLPEGEQRNTCFENYGCNL
jgi:hypothetical protein